MKTFSKVALLSLLVVAAPSMRAASPDPVGDYAAGYKRAATSYAEWALKALLVTTAGTYIERNLPYAGAVSEWVAKNIAMVNNLPLIGSPTLNKSVVTTAVGLAAVVAAAQALATKTVRNALRELEPVRGFAHRLLTVA